MSERVGRGVCDMVPVNMELSAVTGDKDKIGRLDTNVCILVEDWVNGRLHARIQRGFR